MPRTVRWIADGIRVADGTSWCFDFRMTLSHTNQVTADWSERGGYMLARHGIHPAWANEALDDPDRLVITPDPASKSGRAVRTIGWSYTANRIITVITLVDNGRLHGVNGWVANSNDQRLYREEDRDE